MKKTTFIIAMSLMLTNLNSAFSQQEKLVDFNRIYLEELLSGGFELKNKQTLKIETAGFHMHDKHRDVILGNAWILNAETREVVWTLQKDKQDTNGEVVFNDKITLPAGKYQAYYSSFPVHIYDDAWADQWHNYEWDGLGDFIRRVNRSRKDGHWDDYDDLYDDYRLVIRGTGKALQRDELKKLSKAIWQSALIPLYVRRGEQRKAKSFRLQKPTDLKISAAGEARQDGNFDYGVIINTNTLERVWELTYDNTEHAGGARKNRRSNKTIHLPAGDYAAIFTSDDSHSPSEWNAAPPYDPAFWGMTITLKNSADRKYVKLLESETIELGNAIIDFTKLRDEAYHSQGFTLKKPMKVRVVAIGEGSKGDMFDYGWILNAKSRKKVWEMDYDNTDHAGGGLKNRMTNEIIHLEKGSYIAYFVTDGSHSYRDWNTSPPVLQEFWGMAILPGDKNYQKNDVVEYIQEKSKNILAQIIRVGDHDYKRKRFTVAKDSQIRIHSLGEGTRGGMYDYGWIEEAKTGDVVWEMRYRKTEHAGGASKNRSAEEMLDLKAGEYVLFYESDDSHSFGDWNAAAPYDPESWGITVFLAINK